MRNKLLLLFIIAKIFISGRVVFSQILNDWTDIIKITESNSGDHHPSFARGYDFVTLSSSKKMLAFDRTDSLGTNICVLQVDKNGWSSTVQYITSGPGINEYPSISSGYKKSMLVFQKKQENGYNIFYSILDSAGWSNPLPITNDTDQINRYPNIDCYSNYVTIDTFIVAWERNGKICLREYKGSFWSDIIYLTKDDSLQNTKPIVIYPRSYSGKMIHVIWEREKNSKQIEKKHDLYHALYKDEIWKIDTITTVGDNRNPCPVNYFYDISWQRKTDKSWELYSCGDLARFPEIIHSELSLSDSAWNFTQPQGINVVSPIRNKYQTTNSISGYMPFSVGCWIKSKDTLQNIILYKYTAREISQSGLKQNPVIGAFSEYRGARIWAVWENYRDGVWNLYGSSTFVVMGGIEDKNDNSNYTLYQNYPNPFNPVTIIRYKLQVNAFITLKIFDIMGREVKTLANERQLAGEHKITFDGKGMPSGIYYYRISGGSQSTTGKMLLLK
jgi:hypothetical protein